MAENTRNLNGTYEISLLQYLLFDKIIPIPLIFFHDNLSGLKSDWYEMRCAYHYKSSRTDKETN